MEWEYREEHWPSVDRLNALGALGWELFTTRGMAYLLKRPSPRLARFVISEEESEAIQEAWRKALRFKNPVSVELQHEPKQTLSPAGMSELMARCPGQSHT